jgi:hypothetical protein
MQIIKKKHSSFPVQKAAVITDFVDNNFDNNDILWLVINKMANIR